jgi:hypothetical protein
VSLTYWSRVVAEVKVSDLHGFRGIGLYQLGFSLEFNVTNWGEKDERILLQNFRLKVSANSERRNYQLLGYAEPERAWFIQPTQHASTDRVLFLLNLGESQLLALEEIRNGNGLFFQLHLYGEGVGPQRMQCQDELQYEANLSKWVQILKQLELSDVLLVGIHLPSGRAGDKLRPAVDLVRKAYQDLLAGNYEHVVVACRKALDSVHTVFGQREDIRRALERFRNDKESRESMTKVERELVVSEAVRHYTHLAHHVNREGAPEYYSRSDASFMIAVASAVITSAIARMK